MAARSAAKQSPSSVIDLTVSDDEDNRPTRTPSTQRPSTLANQLLQSLPPSNHGLILPGTFDFGARPQCKGNIQNRNHKTDIPISQAAQSLGANQLKARSQSTIQPQTNTIQASSRRSTEQSFSRTAWLATDLRIPVEGNAAKRRKTDGGVASQVLDAVAPATVTPAQKALAASPERPPSSTPALILPPMYRAPGVVRRKINGSAISEDVPPTPVSARIRPAQGPKNVPTRTHQRVSPVTQPGIGPVTRRAVSLAAQLQADRSRVGLNGRIQKPKNLPARAASVGPKDKKECIDDVLRNQVFKHIKSATSQYRLSLSGDDRSKIGTKTAGRLVADRKFLENLMGNEWKLSLEYERNLSLKAKAYVDKYASEILNGVASGSEEAAKGPDVTFEDSPPNHPTNETETLRASSSCSDAEEIFENPPVMKSSPPPSRRYYSSSPTTSFSIDANDESILDVNSHGDSKWHDKVETRQISYRLRRGSRKPRLNQIQAMDIDLPRESSEPKKKPEMADFSVMREIQSLRLAAADRSTPRPYLSFRDREDIRRGCQLTNRPGRSLSRADQDLLEQAVFHVDFCREELDFLCKVIQTFKKDNDSLPLGPDLRMELVTIMSKQESLIPSIKSALKRVVKVPDLLQRRSDAAIDAFLHDAAEGKIEYVPQCSRIKFAPRHKKAPAKPLISSLLRQREIHGMAPVRVRRGQQPFDVEIASHLEDSLHRRSEWTDCCGDISTVCWTGENTFICGATAHSDYHNMQYNKPGNLVVGSTSLDTLRAVSNHRVRRPVVGREENAENALESMRQTQDPWLYTSVVSTSHSEISSFTFSASFDHTVKVWKISPDGFMDHCGTWDHDGKVNFVVTSDHHERVATASDVCSDAIRVYNFDEEDIRDTPYDTYCGEKAREQALEIKRRDTWAYFPATIQWGKAPDVVNFLLVGYSPRSVTAHEIDIPEDKKNSGELCLWNVELGIKIPISSAKTQNVFEVMWHPTQPLFLAATSPCGNFEPETRTQVRLFAQNETGSFLHIKALDCPAFDINELTIMPNSPIQCYVTASCTDGNTYVWDTAQGDDPIHTLGHGESLDNPIHDLPREIADTGVKFASWGKTTDRFYTGSTDGKVKAWDIRKPKGHAFVRNVLSVSGGISAGAFSKNYSKLLIGDATGKVHLLEVDDSDPNDSTPTKKPLRDSRTPAQIPELLGRSKDSGPTKTLQGSGLPEKRPKVIIPHPQPDPPPDFEQEENELTAQEMALQYLEEGHLTMHSDPGIGAVQGPNYAETLLYCYEAHKGADGTLPLLPEWQAKQRYEVQSREEDLKLPRLPAVKSSNQSQHAQNLSLDFEFSRLSLITQQDLIRDGVDLDFEPDQKFDFELLPRSQVFKERKARQKRTHNI